MLPKVFIALTILFAFGGAYHMSWKQRRVPILTIYGPGFEVEQFRSPGKAWILFTMAVCWFLAFILSL